MFSYPLLLCDLGGTNCRFAIVHEAGGNVETLDPVTTDAFPAFADALEAILTQHTITPASFILCAAAAITGTSVTLTNAAWHIDGPALAKQFNLQQGLMLNDFEALALSLPIVKPEWTAPVGKIQSNPARPRLVMGPGTGFGAAAMVPANGGMMALVSEAGHTDFAATNETEQAIWEQLRKHSNHSGSARITPETILSGSGLIRLHHARMMVMGKPVTGSKIPLPPLTSASAQQITAAALADHSCPEADSVRLFWQLMARHAGDLALIYFAQGGVTLAGGILPRIAPLLDEAEFRTVFEDKAPMQAIVQATPVHLLVEKDIVLHGMAAIAAKPGGYLLNYETRNWRP